MQCTDVTADTGDPEMQCHDVTADTVHPGMHCNDVSADTSGVVVVLYMTLMEGC